ncbi:hypothetical protein [Pseudomonas sp. UBA4194]|uniref:hypothetical protein n=1 Tax=Pseudomonas sp. UBA4194 TaxID=1947317 RepID=UPI0039C92A0B
MIPVATSAGSPHLTVRQEWLAQVREPALEPELAIVDAHHHLWDRPAGRYLMEDYLADINASGHAVVASIYAQCRTMFDLSRPPASQSVGEVEFANGVAACSASGQYGHPRINAGIIAGADLCLAPQWRRCSRKCVSGQATGCAVCATPRPGTLMPGWSPIRHRPRPAS